MRQAGNLGVPAQQPGSTDRREVPLMRIRTLTMLGLALVTVGACSGSAATTAPASAAAANYKLTLIQGVQGDPFYVTMACGAQAEATKEGVTLTVTGGNKWDATV